MLVLRPIAGRLDELLELHIGDRTFIDQERLDIQLFVVGFSRPVFPRILHVSAVVVASFDLDARDLEAILARRNQHHAVGRRRHRFRRRDLDDFLRQHLPLRRIAAQRNRRQTRHGANQPLHVRRRLLRRHGENRAVAAGLDREGQPGRLAGDRRLQLDAIPQIVVAHALGMRHGKLLAAKILVRAIDHEPQGSVLCRKSAGEYTLLKRGDVRLPVLADHHVGRRPFDRGDAAQGFGVAWGQLVPHTPDVFPSFVADAVEKGRLHSVGPVLRPAFADVDQTPRLHPLVLADHRNRQVVPVAPAQGVPGDHGLFVQSALRLKRQRMPDGVSSVAELDGNAIHRVAVDPVGVDFLHIASGGLAQRHAFGPRADVPRHDGKQHPHAAAMEVGHHLFDAGQPAGHVAEQVVLVAIVDADVRIDRPDQHRVDPAVASRQIVEVAVHRVLTELGIIEVPLFDHHLRLDEVALRPPQFRPLIFGAVVLDAFAFGVAPTGHFAQPGCSVCSRRGAVEYLVTQLQFHVLSRGKGGRGAEDDGRCQGR